MDSRKPGGSVTNFKRGMALARKGTRSYFRSGNRLVIRVKQRTANNWENGVFYD